MPHFVVRKNGEIWLIVFVIFSLLYLIPRIQYFTRNKIGWMLSPTEQLQTNRRNNYLSVLGSSPHHVENRTHKDVWEDKENRKHVGVVLHEGGEQEGRRETCHERPLAFLCLSFPPTKSSVSECLSNPSRYLAKIFSSPKRRANADLGDRALHLSRTSGSVRLIIGSGSPRKCATNWLCTERADLDLFKVEDWAVFQRTGIDIVFSEHVLEHMTPLQVRKIAATAFLFLQPGGRVRTAVPDGYRPDPAYQQYVKAGSTASGAGQNHMVVWTTDTLPPLFEDIGFSIFHQEHWKLNGFFFQNATAYDRDEEFGKVGRSKKHDPRNIGAGRETIGWPKMRGYSSLWFDAVKPLDCPLWKVAR
jgi:predicted SAM-dependent methyltransferase